MCSDTHIYFSDDPCFILYHNFIKTIDYLIKELDAQSKKNEQIVAFNIAGQISSFFKKKNNLTAPTVSVDQHSV